MLFIYKINELTFIENCVINFSQTVSLHWVSGIDFSHIWLTWSALPSVELPSVGDLLASWLWLPWQAIYKTYCLKIIQKFYVHVHNYVCTRWYPEIKLPLLYFLLKGKLGKRNPYTYNQGSISTNQLSPVSISPCSVGSISQTPNYCLICSPKIT